MNQRTLEASWQPDPSGRHEYRWWDGQDWTDAVADHGRATTDPLAARPTLVNVWQPTPVTGPQEAPEPEPATEVPRQVRTFDPEGARLAEVPRPKRRRFNVFGVISWLVGVMALVAVLAVLWVRYRPEHTAAPKAAPPTVTTATIDVEGGGVSGEVTIDKGSAARFRVEAAAGLEVDAFVVDPKGTTDSGGETYQGLPVVARLCCPGDPVLTGRLVSPGGGTFQLVVVSTKGIGAIRLVVEHYAGTAPTTSEGQATDGFFTDADFYSDTGAYTP